jgi:hypothetical protein
MMVILMGAHRHGGSRQPIQMARIREWQRQATICLALPTGRRRLQQADEFRDRKTGLADDCAQRAALEIPAVSDRSHE